MQRFTNSKISFLRNFYNFEQFWNLQKTQSIKSGVSSDYSNEIEHPMFQNFTFPRSKNFNRLSILVIHVHGRQYHYMSYQADGTVILYYYFYIRLTYYNNVKISLFQYFDYLKVSQISHHFWSFSGISLNFLPLHDFNMTITSW